jgi:Lon protease-like protein
MTVAGYQSLEDLPEVIPIFPLDGALLLPGAGLPLNIFEPRYLNMIDDAMSGHRIIGMVQTVPGGSPEKPSLTSIGCAGRVTSYAETGDGRYIITLTGVCRFRIAEETPAHTPYRQVRADFAPFGDDLREEVGQEPGHTDPQFLLALKTYLERRGLSLDWKTAEHAPPDALVTSLAMGLPFDPAEKQALLEAPTLLDRFEALYALLQIDGAAEPDAGPAALQ